MIVTKYAIEIVIDDLAWQQNYGTDGLLATAEDVRDSMASIVAGLVDEWIEKSGNQGAVTKIKSYKAVSR